jgi:FolB domain-containing protein
MEKKIVEIEVRDLRLRAIIGFIDWEREQKQDVVISYSYKYDAAKAIKSDNAKNAADYKTLTKKIICLVEGSQFNLLETLSDSIYRTIAENKDLFGIKVRVEKPGALRFADNVLINITSENFND